MQLSRIGPFALEEPLGGDRTSNVVRGVHVQQGASAAIKLLPTELVATPLARDNFLTDAQQLKTLAHRGIARVYGGEIQQGQPYLALELVDGETLETRAARLGRLPWETIVEIADHACLALRYAHRAQVTHCRVTPHRILLPVAGGVKLIGFDRRWTDRDEVLGLRSPMAEAHYLAPEAFRGRSSATAASCDLFSMGVILYRCLTGEMPWPAATPAELIRARRAAPAPRASAQILDCPVWLDVLVSRLLERKRSARIRSADEAHRAIVDARQKAAAGTGTAQHAWSGREGSLAVHRDQPELQQLRRKQVRKQDHSPFYERAWFLAMCLGGLLWLATWSLWPQTEDELFLKATVLMESDRAADWRRAESQYLDELQRRFPDTRYRHQIDAFRKRLAMHQALESIKNLERFNRLPKTEAQRQFAAAWREERHGDRLTAMRQYEALAQRLADCEDPLEQALGSLAEEGAARIRSEVDTPPDRSP
jgi:serine/threonine protein kinase